MIDLTGFESPIRDIFYIPSLEDVGKELIKLHGVPVLERSYVPKGEIWFITPDTKVVLENLEIKE